MENIPVTTYRGFSAVSGETTFTQDMADIRNGKHAKLIIKIASLVAQGKVEEANHVKKQLPFRTLTANYRERRLAPSITRYNPVITLDIDDLEERQLEQTRTLINEDPHTLGSFLSPKRHGYKLFVFMQTEYTRRLYDRLREGEVTYATLEEIHLKLYSAAKEHYEALLGVEVDGSGKDISRGYFMSFDPHAYINAALLEQISPLPARIIPPAKKESGKKKTSVETARPPPASSAATPQDAKPWEKLIFSQAVTAVKRTTRFRAGNRDNFLFALGNKCYSKGLDEQTAIRLAKNEFGQEYPDVESPLHNAYIYTDKTSEAATKKEEKKARHQPSDELSGRALRHPQEPHSGPPRIHALHTARRSRKRLPPHARKGLQHHVRRPADGRHLLLPEFPQSRDRLQLRQGVQPLHRLSVRASPWDGRTTSPNLPTP